MKSKDILNRTCSLLRLQLGQAVDMSEGYCVDMQLVIAQLILVLVQRLEGLAQRLEGLALSLVQSAILLLWRKLLNLPLDRLHLLA